MKMNKKTQRILVIGLVIIMLGSTLGMSIASVISNNNSQSITENSVVTTKGTYIEKLEETLNKAIKDKNTVKDSVLSDLLKRNDASDYSLETTLNILGYPVCVLESYDSKSINVYSEEEEIKTLLTSISTNKNYTNNSFIQLYWMKENGETVITWIALNEEDMTEVKTVGIITSQYQSLEEMKLKETDVSTLTFESLTMKENELIEKYNPLLYQTQNKLLNCKFIVNLMESDEYNYIWKEYVLKTKDSYVFINTKEDSIYLVYENLSDYSNIEKYDQSVLDTIKDGMTLEEFLAIVPNARLLEVYNHNDKNIYKSYAVLSKEDKETLIYYDFCDGILELKQDNSVSENVNDENSLMENTTEQLESTESTEKDI